MPKGSQKYRVVEESFVVREVEWDEDARVFVAEADGRVLLEMDGNTYEGKARGLLMELTKKRKRKRG